MEETPQDVSPEEARLLLALTRLEAKLDVALADHGADLRNHAARLDDHDKRLRKLEETPTVSPQRLFTSLTAAVGLLVSILMLVINIT